MHPAKDQEESRPARQTRAGTSIRENLRCIAYWGFDDVELADCAALAQLAYDRLGIQPVSNKNVTRDLLESLLRSVTDAQRQIAFDAGDASIAEGKIVGVQGGKGPFLVAAASEVLGLTNETIFRHVREVLGVDDEQWDGLESNERKGGVKRVRQLRAGLWLGELPKANYSSKRARGRQEELLGALEKTTNDYLGDEGVRRSLNEYLAELLGKSRGSGPEKGAVSDEAHPRISRFDVENPEPGTSARETFQLAGLVPFAAAVHQALDAERASCRARNRPFLTPNLLLALLELPNGKVGACFNATRDGLAVWARDQLRYYLASSELDEVDFIPFEWVERPEVARAQELAWQTAAPVVTDLHLLIGVLDSESTTRRQLAEFLGSDFGHLRENALQQSQDTEARTTPGSVWGPDDGR